MTQIIYVPELESRNFSNRELFQEINHEIDPAQAVQILIFEQKMTFGYIDRYINTVHRRADGTIDELRFVVVRDEGQNREGAFAALRSEFQKLIAKNPHHYGFREDFFPKNMGI